MRARARNRTPSEYPQISDHLRDLAEKTLHFDPAIHLLIGPQGVRVLRRLDRGEAVRSVELILLSRALSSAGVRGTRMHELFTKAQQKQISDLTHFSTMIEGYLTLLGFMSPEQADMLLRKYSRERNPVATAQILLQPQNEDHAILAERVVGLYAPVFQWEPRVQTQRQNTDLVVTVQGDQADVTELVEVIRTTLGANRYRGTFDAQLEARVPNRKSRLLR